MHIKLLVIYVHWCYQIAGHIQEIENQWKNKKRKRKGEEEIPPLYTAEEAARSLEILEPVQYDEIIEITPEIHVRFNDAGHMLGSSIIELWTNENDIVFTPFLGIGSECYQALSMNRRAVGIELKESYYNQAVATCKGIVSEPKMKKLF